MADSEQISSREFSRVQAESIHRKGVIKDLRAKLAAFEGQLSEKDAAIKDFESKYTAALAERDGLQAKLTAAPSELQAELDKLKGELRTRDIRTKFDHVSKDLIRPDGLDAAWKLAGINTDADEINEDELKKAVGSLVESNPFLKPDPVGSQPVAGGQQHVTQQPRTAGPGLTRAVVSATSGTSGGSTTKPSYNGRLA